MDSRMEGKQFNDQEAGTSDRLPHVHQQCPSSIQSEDSAGGHIVPPDVKRRKKIQMNDQQCLNHSRTSEGAMPLTNPKPQGLSKSRNWDANRGLYPRQSNSRRHWSPNKGSRIRGQGQSTSSGSPMKQERIDSFFPTSPKKLPNNNVVCRNDDSQNNTNHTQSQTHDRHLDLSACNSRNSWTCAQTVCETLPTNGDKHNCSKGIVFQKPHGIVKKTPKKSFTGETQGSKISPRVSVGNLNTGPAVRLTRDISLKTAHSPVKALFQERHKSRCSADLLRAFEEDDSITTEMFDDAMATGTISQGTSKQTSRDKPGCSSDFEKDFEDDDSFTAEDFDEVIQLSQGSVKSDEKQQETTNAFEDELDDLTAEEFDDILQSSQSPVKNRPFQSSPKKSTYGLLGDGNQSFSDDQEEDDGVDHFSRLPDEILENILGQLPILDMCLTAASVCQRWHDIVSNERFIPWKKRYHQMKKVQNPDYIKEIESLIADDNELVQRSCLVHLIGFMKNLRVTEKSTIDCLRGHPRFNEAVRVMKEKTPHVFENQDPHPWSTVATIVILSQSAMEVCRILDCLLLRNNPVPRIEVSECFYCLASALFLFQRKFKINRGLHYRVFHALHVLESGEPSRNASRKGSKRQKSIKRNGPMQDLNLTPEQMRIINHNLVPTDTIKIIAFAGTGKTTTLIRFAERRPHLNFLYIAFNKTVQQQAVDSFPKNVECRTLHSLAYRAVGFQYKKKMGTTLRPFFITSLLPKKAQIKTGRQEKKAMHHMTLAKHVCTTINHFLASDDEFITTAHTPTMDTSSLPRQPLEHSVKMDIARAAQHVLDALCDVNNIDAKITHDVYMKLYELQKPQLAGYDCLLIDEAQDLTLAQQSILLRQRCAKILVGDPNQQIYSFRGATNAMARVEATRMYHLTQSFRFGPEIAYIANCLLEVLKRQTKSTIIGAGPPGQIDGGHVGQLATICRGNGTLFTEAVKMVTNDQNIKIQFSGGIEGYGFDKVLDLYYLSLPLNERGDYKMKDKFISRFKSLGNIECYAKAVDDMELQSRMNLVKQYHSRIPDLVEKIKKASSSFNAGFLLTTAHKAKGLEFDTVKLTDDFVSDSILEQICIGNQTMEDEKNILYVAVTRAKKSLQLNDNLIKYLRKAQERFEYPVLAKTLKEEKGPQRCQECGVVQSDDKQLLLLERKHIKLTLSVGSHSIEGGIVCPKCIDAPGFEDLYQKPPPTEEELRAIQAANNAQQQVGVFIRL